MDLYSQQDLAAAQEHLAAIIAKHNEALQAVARADTEIALRQRQLNENPNAFTVTAHGAAMRARITPVNQLTEAELLLSDAKRRAERIRSALEHQQ